MFVDLAKVFVKAGKGGKGWKDDPIESEGEGGVPCVGGEGDVHRIALSVLLTHIGEVARPGVYAPLVYGDVQHVVPPVEYLVGAVPVVDVYVHHRHTSAPVSMGGGGNGHVIEVAKAHGAFRGGMMPRRA